MKNNKKELIRKLCVIVGACLMIAGAAVLLAWQLGIQDAQKQSQAYVSTIRTLIPNPQSAVPEERLDNTMPVLSLDGTDFIGILEMPKYGSSLPVCANWDQLTKYPCCFSGSAYDRTLQIGSTTQPGQYDFYESLSVGDLVFFTDMEGNRFSYTITDIRYSDHADRDALTRQPADLTLFIKNIYSLEYIFLFCDTAAN